MLTFFVIQCIEIKCCFGYFQLQEDEEELRREEESYLEAKRESSRIAKLHQQKEDAAQKSNGPKSWKAGADGDWEV